jgi:putative acetyltransferase
LAEVASAAYRAGFAAILDVAELARRNPESFVVRFETRLDSLRAAETGGRVAGFALASGRHLDMLFVDPAAQGGGIGAALLDDAVAHGVCSLECFRANAPARRFYDRRGWVVTRGYARLFAGRIHGFVFYELDRKARALPSTR